MRRKKQQKQNTSKVVWDNHRKLSADEVQTVLVLLSKGQKEQEIADMFGVNIQMINQIIGGKLVFKELLATVAHTKMLIATGRAKAEKVIIKNKAVKPEKPINFIDDAIAEHNLMKSKLSDDPEIYTRQLKFINKLNDFYKDNTAELTIKQFGLKNVSELYKLVNRLPEREPKAHWKTGTAKDIGLSENQLRDALAQHINGKSVVSIAEHFKVDMQSLYRILSKMPGYNSKKKSKKSVGKIKIVKKVEKPIIKDDEVLLAIEESEILRDTMIKDSFTVKVKEEVKQTPSMDFTIEESVVDSKESEYDAFKDNVAGICGRLINVESHLFRFQFEEHFKNSIIKEPMLCAADIVLKILEPMFEEERNNIMISLDGGY